MNPAHVEPSPPRVTALIVARNCAAQLRSCVEALERSSERERLEILIVDNGSTDGSAEVLTEFPEVQTLRLPKEFGRTKATNIGLRTAKGNLIFLLPPNVEVETDTIAALASRLEDSSGIGAVCPKIDRWFHFPNSDALREACLSGSLPDPQPMPTEVAEIAIDYAPGAPMMVTRVLIRGMNNFDDQYGEYWPDLDFCFRLRSDGKNILALPGVKVRYGPTPTVADDAVHRADCVIGAAVYLGKHSGTSAGLKFRLSAILGALFKADFSLLSALISGQKVDGTHA